MRQGYRPNVQEQKRRHAFEKAVRRLIHAHDHSSIADNGAAWLTHKPESVGDALDISHGVATKLEKWRG
ncbi:MAG TPA: hypothetical protein VFW34_06890 [Candidatus Rubrimentiphilum sp.]|nr:hypothetical protein [Candidatus Rubrimentiphilum sp.]